MGLGYEQKHTRKYKTIQFYYFFLLLTNVEWSKRTTGFVARVDLLGCCGDLMMGRRGEAEAGAGTGVEGT